MRMRVLQPPPWWLLALFGNPCECGCCSPRLGGCLPSLATHANAGAAAPALVAACLLWQLMRMRHYMVRPAGQSPRKPRGRGDGCVPALGHPGPLFNRRQLERPRRRTNYPAQPHFHGRARRPCSPRRFGCANGCAHDQRVWQQCLRGWPPSSPWRQHVHIVWMQCSAA